MSDIPYPHQVNIWRRSTATGEDQWGRDIPGAPVLVDTVPAWVQALDQQERTDLTEAGAVRLDCLIFMDPPAVGLAESDAIETVAGGGQIDDVWHRISRIEAPDGTGDHFEIYTVVVKDVEQALVEPATVSS